MATARWSTRPLPPSGRENKENGAWFTTRGKALKSPEVRRQGSQPRLRNFWTSKICNIPERSTGDVWALRSVKNGVSTVVPLWQNSEVISDGSECQSPEMPHFWQGRRLRQTGVINRDVPAGMPAGRGKMQNDMQEDFDNWIYTLREAGLKIGLIRYAKPVLKVGLICYAKPNITHDHAKRAVMKQLCEINATF